MIYKEVLVELMFLFPLLGFNKSACTQRSFVHIIHAVINQEEINHDIMLIVLARSFTYLLGADPIYRLTNEVFWCNIHNVNNNDEYSTTATTNDNNNNGIERERIKGMKENYKEDKEE